jgi:hypothetical protein
VKHTLGANAAVPGPVQVQFFQAKLQQQAVELFLALHGTGTRHDHKSRPPDLQVPDLYDRICFLEFPAGELVGFQDGHRFFHPGQTGNGLELLFSPPVPDGPDERSFHPLGKMDLVPDGLDPFDHFPDLPLAGVAFHDDDHGCWTSDEKGHGVFATMAFDSEK